MQEQLRSLERDTGWRVRLLSRFGQDASPSIDDIRSAWFNSKTIVFFVDPSSPNIISFKWGREVQRMLPRRFFNELQSRFGNVFVVREAGEAAAVEGALDALVTCLRREGGCAAVPGLSTDQYSATLLTSVAGGAVLGSVLRIDPDPRGFVKRRWVWALVFSPLWATLAINFGLGPVVSRTDDPLPVAANLTACAAVAALIYFYPQAARAVGLTSEERE